MPCRTNLVGRGHRESSAGRRVLPRRESVVWSDRFPESADINLPGKELALSFEGAIIAVQVGPLSLTGTAYGLA